MVWAYLIVIATGSLFFDVTTDRQSRMTSRMCRSIHIQHNAAKPIEHISVQMDDDSEISDGAAVQFLKTKLKSERPRNKQQWKVWKRISRERENTPSHSWAPNPFPLGAYLVHLS